MNTPIDAPIRCPHCQKSYSRNEHLQRHLPTHSTARQFACDHCPKRFHRKDLLKRHGKICKPGFQIRYYNPNSTDTLSSDVEGDAPSSQRRKRNHSDISGDRRTTIQTVESDEPASSFPEQFCFVGDDEVQNRFLDEMWDTFNGLESTINFPSPLLNLTEPSPVPISDHGGTPNSTLSISSEWELASLNNPDPVSKFDWLNQYSTAGGMSSKFNHTKDLLGRRELRTKDTNNIDFNFLDTRSQPSEKTFLDFEEVTEQDTASEEWTPDPEDEFPTHPTLNPRTWHCDPLALKTNEIVSRIKEAVQLKPRNSIISFDWSTLLEEMCVSFFSPPNIRRLTDLFFSGWYPHWPVIHKPTFDPSSTPPTLLASMMLIGACTSMTLSDHKGAQIWGNSVEEMAFNDEYFCGNIIVSAQRSHTMQRRVQALQAAHAACLYQYYEGDDVSKRRVRTYRYSAEVVMARELGFFAAKHENLESLTESTFSWESFLLKEEMIRTLLYVFILDSAFGVANNQPPRIVIQELEMDLVCPELCFQADSATKCLQHIQTMTSSRLWRPNVSIFGAVDAFQHMQMGPDALDFFCQVGSLNLYAIAAAIHSITFQMRLALGGNFDPVPVQTMLTNWKNVWTNRNRPRNLIPFGISSFNMDEMIDSPMDWRREGFMKHAPEVWLLAKKLLSLMQSCKHHLKHSAPLEFATSSPHALLDGSSIVLPAREKYDDTSMSQLNHLLNAFESMSV